MYWYILSHPIRYWYTVGHPISAGILCNIPNSELVYYTLSQNLSWNILYYPRAYCDGAGVTYANAGNCYNCPLHQKVCAS